MIAGKPLSASIIAVVGPDRADLSDDVLAAAGRVAEQLGKAGYGVITRCGPGVSTAVARAALDAGAALVAVKTDGGPSHEPPSGADVVAVAGPLAAVQEILNRAEAAIVVAPDVETLALLCQIWAFGATPDAPYRQVILVGAAWRATVKVLADAAGLDARTRAMVSFAETPHEAVESLRYYVAP